MDSDTSAARGTHPSADVDEVLTNAARIAVPTDSSDNALGELRASALDLAARYDLEVVLYDRSDETWMDHPHPKGPIERDAIDANRRPELVEQLDEFLAHSVPARAWIATVPSLTEIVDVVREVGVDVVLVPEHTDGSKVIDRIKSGGPAAIVERITTLNLERPVSVLVRHDDGSVTLADSELH